MFRRGPFPRSHEVRFLSVKLIFKARGSNPTLTLRVRYCFGSAPAPPLGVHLVHMGLTPCYLTPSPESTPSAVVVLEVPLRFHLLLLDFGPSGRHILDLLTYFVVLPVF